MRQKCVCSLAVPGDIPADGYSGRGMEEQAIKGENFMRKRELLPQIKLSDLQKEKLNAEIKAFYLDQRGEEPGVIEQMQLLELFEQKLAPVIYNKALDDAKKWYVQMMDNLDSDFYTLYKNEN